MERRSNKRTRKGERETLVEAFDVWGDAVTRRIISLAPNWITVFDDVTYISFT